MPAWVYRRPSHPIRRRFVPYTFAASRVVVVHRRRMVARPRFHRPQRAAIAAIMGVQAAAAAGQVAILRRHVQVGRRAALQRRPVVVHGFQEPAAPGQGQVFARALRFIARYRRAARRRLFWEPPPELVPTPPEVIGQDKGRVFTPGWTRARVKVL